MDRGKIVVTKRGDVAVNVIGTKDLESIYGSHIQEIEDITGIDYREISCAASGCTRNGQHGAHIRLLRDNKFYYNDDSMFLISFCAPHNNPRVKKVSLKDGYLCVLNHITMTKHQSYLDRVDRREQTDNVQIQIIYDSSDDSDDFSSDSSDDGDSSYYRKSYTKKYGGSGWNNCSSYNYGGSKWNDYGSSKYGGSKWNDYGSYKYGGSKWNDYGSSKYGGSKWNDYGSYKYGGSKWNDYGSSKYGGSKWNGYGSSKYGGRYKKDY